MTTNLPKDHKFTKWPQIYQKTTNLPNDQKFTKWPKNIPTFSVPRPLPNIPKLVIWYENIPSGNPNLAALL
jgi:hypothetical protein